MHIWWEYYIKLNTTMDNMYMLNYVLNIVYDITKMCGVYGITIWCGVYGNIHTPKQPKLSHTIWL